MKRINKIILATSLSLIIASNAVMARDDTLQLPQLMHMLALNKSGKATFVEKKYIGILNQPVVSTGKLAFIAPDHLEKSTLTPKPEILLLNGDILTIDRPEKQKKVISLGDHPEVTAFIESIRGTLAGDITALQTYYTLELTGSTEKWELVLTPKQERLSRIISHIRIGGIGGNVKTIELDQSDGDHSIMAITGASLTR